VAINKYQTNTEFAVDGFRVKEKEAGTARKANPF
jgi:hypothetical protein